MKCGSSKVLQLRGKKSDAVVLFCSAAVLSFNCKTAAPQHVLYPLTAALQHCST
jgi:hypothetical protein